MIAAGALTSVSGLSTSPSRVNKALGGLADYSHHEINKCLLYLRMQGYIRYDRSEFKVPLLITRKGLERHAVSSLREKLATPFAKHWDHLWRIVAFDVPESKKNRRDQFRDDLCKLGFFPFQKSIYVTPFAREDAMRELARRRGIGKYVLVSVTPNLGWRESYAIRWFADYIKWE